MIFQMNLIFLMIRDKMITIMQEEMIIHMIKEETIIMIQKENPSTLNTKMIWHLKDNIHKTLWTIMIDKDIVKESLISHKKKTTEITNIYETVSIIKLYLIL